MVCVFVFLREKESESVQIKMHYGVGNESVFTVLEEGTSRIFGTHLLVYRINVL